MNARKAQHCAGPDQRVVCDGTTSRMLDEWAAARAALAEMERAEHPDITDARGRVWSWWRGDLYRHTVQEGEFHPNPRITAGYTMAWPREHVEAVTA